MLAQVKKSMDRKRDSLECAPTSSGELHSELPSGQHLPYDLMEAYVDGRLRRDRIGSHLLRCKNCSEELENLLGFARACEISEELAVRSVQPARLEEVAVRSEPASWILPKRSWFTFRRSLLVGAQVVIGWSALASVGIFALMLVIRSSNTKAPTSATQTQETQVAASRSKSGITADISYLGPDLLPIVAKTIENGRIQQPQVLADLMSGQSWPPTRESVRGQDLEGASPLLSPAGTVVFNTAPTFRWSALREADRYIVRVYDAAFNLVESSPRVTNTAWKSSLALHPGKIYSWQITAMKGAEEITGPLTGSPPARFKILDMSQRRQLGELNKAHPGAHLILGIIDAHAGLLDDAEIEFLAVPKSDPNYELAQKFLQDLQQLRKLAG
jgi:hypothetical protein